MCAMNLYRVRWAIVVMVVVSWQVVRAEDEGPRIRLLGASTTTSISVSQPTTSVDDKSRLMAMTQTIEGLQGQLSTSFKQSLGHLNRAQQLFGRPSDVESFLDRLYSLSTTLPPLQRSLRALRNTLVQLQRAGVPHKTALSPAVQAWAGAGESLVSVSLTYTDDPAALDIAAHYVKLSPQDEGFGVVARHDLTPQKHRASLAVMRVGQELRRLGGEDATRLITAIDQLFPVVERLDQQIAPVSTGILELEPLVKDLGERPDPQRFEQLAGQYDALISPFRSAVEQALQLVGPQGEEFDRFFHPFRSSMQEAMADLVRSALVPHVGVSGGIHSYRRSGRFSHVGIALSQQVPIGATEGVLWSLSAQAISASNENGDQRDDVMWGAMVAWLDKVSSYDDKGNPVLRRWQRQIGFEFTPASRVNEQSYGLFVRWRPAQHPCDYLLFWSQTNAGPEWGIALRTAVGLQRY